MTNIIRTLSRIVLICVIFISFGCTATRSFHTSTPNNKIVETDVFTANIEPQKNDSAFFSTFMLTIVNKSNHDIQINWNESYYLHNKKNESAFVFRGIEPAQVKKKTVPNEIIAANSRFSKKISPLSKIARASIRDASAIDDKGLYAGMLPEGLNSVVMVLEDNGEKIKKIMSLTIKNERSHDY